MSGMSFAGMEEVYEALALGVDLAGPEKEALFLMRLALLLAQRDGDAAAVKASIAAALEGLE